MHTGIYKSDIHDSEVLDVEHKCWGCFKQGVFLLAWVANVSMLTSILLLAPAVMQGLLLKYFLST